MIDSKRCLVQWFFLLVLITIGCKATETKEEKAPNIIYILADDLGIGDVSAYNQASKIATPYIDAFVAQGMKFTDAHSPSAVCTPTRYGLLTGRYCWRSRLPKGVLRGYGKALIDDDRLTVASFLKENGYTTGVVGKWHLGLDWVLKEEYKDSVPADEGAVNEYGMVTQLNGDWVDFEKKPTDGPLHHGFDYSYILPASLDMEPYCYLENDVLTDLPTEYTPGNDLNTGSYATGAFWRPGKISKEFDFYEVLPNFINKGLQFIHERKDDDAPFFLYLPLAAPHSPWVPTSEFVDASGAGQYGDFVQMVDAEVGRFLKQLDEMQKSENTIVIFASDNGPFWKPDFKKRFQHSAADIYRGMKADIHEGGHRIPFVVRWPGKVREGSTSDHLTSLTDLLATCADVLDVSLPDGQGEDSYSIYPVLMGNTQGEVMSPAVIHHSSQGMFAIRKGDWKLIEGRGSGGFTEPVSIEPGEGEPIGQLYNLKEDPSETKNLYQEKPDVVEELLQTLREIRGE